MLPKYLFKYLSVDDLNDAQLRDFEELIKEVDIRYYSESDPLKKWIIFKQIIAHKLLYFCHYTYLNDPFECILNIDYAAGVCAEIIEKYHPIVAEHIQKNLEKNGDPLHLLSLAEFKKHLLNKVTGKQKHYYEPSITNNNLPFGIYSFSANPCNIQMWSYYSNNHKGICLAFEIDWHRVRASLQSKYPDASPNRINEILHTAGFRFDYSGVAFGFQKVEYSQNVLDYPVEKFMKAHFDDTLKDELNWLSTKIKHINWIHEEEWRLVCFNQYSNDAEDLFSLNIFNFIKPCGIIVGAGMNQTLKSILQKNYGNHYPIIEMQPSIDKHALTISYALSPSKDEIENFLSLLRSKKSNVNEPIIQCY